MAQHAILRFEKHKGNPARPLEAHHERQKDEYASNRIKISEHFAAAGQPLGDLIVDVVRHTAEKAVSA